MKRVKYLCLVPGEKNTILLLMYILSLISSSGAGIWLLFAFFYCFSCFYTISSFDPVWPPFTVLDFFLNFFPKFKVTCLESIGHKGWYVLESYHQIIPSHTFNKSLYGWSGKDITLQLVLFPFLSFVDGFFLPFPSFVGNSFSFFFLSAAIMAHAKKVKEKIKRMKIIWFFLPFSFFCWQLPFFLLFVGGHNATDIIGKTLSQRAPTKGCFSLLTTLYQSCKTSILYKKIIFVWACLRLVWGHILTSVAQIYLHTTLDLVLQHYLWKSQQIFENILVGRKWEWHDSF